MKVIFIAVIAMLGVAAVSANCGCLKCSKNLYIPTQAASPVQVIYRGSTCSCNRQIPFTVEQPIITSKSCPTVRHSTYKMIPLKIVKKVAKPTPLYSYDYQVQVPVPEEKRCNKCLVGLIAQPDRVVLPAPSCREPAPSNPSRGPVFEALTPSEEEEDYVYQYQPAKKCGCGRYGDLKNYCIQNRLGLSVRCNDGYRDLTQQEVDDNVNRNIKDIFFEDSFEGKLRRLFFSGLERLQALQLIQKEPYARNFSVSFGKTNFGPARIKRSLNPRKLTRKKPFLAPQRKFAFKTISTQIESPQSIRKKKSVDDDLIVTYEDSNEIPHGHDESYEDSTEEQIYSFKAFDDNEQVEMVSPSKASNLLLNTLHLDQLLPQVPLLFFVNAPISMLAYFHRLNKHFQPVVESVPTVIRTSGKYFSDFGEKFKRSFYVFTNCLLSSIDGITRLKRSIDVGNKKKALDEIKNFEVLKCKVNVDGTVDFVLFNRKSDRKLKNIAVVIENFEGSQEEGRREKVYLAKVDTTSLISTKKKLNYEKRSKRDIFEVDLNGDIQDLINEKWSHLIEEQNEKYDQSAESIFENHFKQIPSFYNAAKKTSNILKKSSSKKSPLKLKPDPILGSSNYNSKTPKDFSDLHPEKNLDIIKKSISTVLAHLQDLLHADIEKDLKYYEELVKLQYLKNTLVIDWRKHLEGDKEKIIAAKMNILNYVKELERFRKSMSKKTVDLLLNQRGNGYNRSDLIMFLVELYKLQMIFTRIHEDLNNKINLGSKFNQQNEDIFIKQLARVQFVDKTNKFELEQRLKEIRDTKVEANMNFLERLRKLAELEDTVEMDHDAREDLHHTARMIKENAHYIKEELKQVKDIGNKVKANQTYRKELKNLWDLERHILENEEGLSKKFAVKLDSGEVNDENVFESQEEEKSEFDILKIANPLGLTLKPLELKEMKVLSDLKPLEWDKDLKSKMDEFAKDMEEKRKAWAKKTRKLAEIMKEP